MNHIGIYTNQQIKEYQKELLQIIQLLSLHNKNVYVQESYDSYYQNISSDININWNYIYYYNNLENIKHKIDLLITIGGDGTILESIHYLYNNLIPVLGINSGRLGFLSNINISETNKAIEALLNNNFTIEKRSMIELAGDNIFDYGNFALNEFTIHKLDTSSMIHIELSINNQHVNTYWADGLIVSTPTGSTAYSLSAGGPIIHPNSNSLVITPIAAHNLNVRPLVVPDNVSIELKVGGRSEHCMISIDHISKAVSINSSFKIIKSKYESQFLHIEPYNFFNTLKNKLLWGVDKRN